MNQVNLCWVCSKVLRKQARLLDSPIHGRLVNWFIGNQLTLMSFQTYPITWDSWFLGVGKSRGFKLFWVVWKRSFPMNLILDCMQLFEAKCFWTQWTQQIEKLMSLFQRLLGINVFFSCFVSDLQWLLFTGGSPTFQAQPPAAASESGPASGGRWPSAVHDFKVPKVRGWS